MKHFRIVFVVVLALAAVPLLVSCGKKSAADPKAQIEKQGFYYTCSMHPQVRESKAGPCPICHMPMVKVETGKPREGAAVPSGTVFISPDKQQRIGVRLGKVERRALTHTIRTTAAIEHDETKLASIAPRFSGWVRALFVDYTGKAVEKGQPLLKVYSPELFSTENEYLLALRNYEKLSESAPADARESAKRLLDSTRRRLELWEIGNEEILEIEKRGAPGDELLIRAPFSGHVVTKNAVAGRAFRAGETLYEIAELSHLWLDVFVYEYELPFIKIGQPARVVMPYLQNREYESEVTFIYPHIDPMTRRAKIRIELGNPEHELRPDMWANVEIPVDLGERLVVPSDAILDSGARKVAFVALPDGHFEPRNVHTGVRAGGFIEVLRGLREGETIVTSALFLIDSESRLKSALDGMEGHQH
jgi:Cu(I)/Ag(I) efflux system membrane fusion protein